MVLETRIPSILNVKQSLISLQKKTISHQTEDYMSDDKDISHLVALQGICVITYGNLENGRYWRTWENTINRPKKYMAEHSFQFICTAGLTTITYQCYPAGALTI